MNNKLNQCRMHTPDCKSLAVVFHDVDQLLQIGYLSLIGKLFPYYVIVPYQSMQLSSLYNESLIFVICNHIDFRTVCINHVHVGNLTKIRFVIDNSSLFGIRLEKKTPSLKYLYDIFTKANDGIIECPYCSLMENLTVKEKEYLNYLIKTQHKVSRMRDRLMSHFLIPNKKYSRIKLNLLKKTELTSEYALFTFCLRVKKYANH